MAMVPPVGVREHGAKVAMIVAYSEGCCSVCEAPATSKGHGKNLITQSNRNDAEEAT